MTAALDHMFRPRSVAVIGASNEPARIGGKPIDYLKRYYSGAIYPINPNRPEIQGLKTYSSILDVPGKVDLALIALPSQAVLGAVEDCIRKGIDACIIFSSGFAEEGETGQAMQAEIRATARRGGIRIMGPNCIGVGNNRIGSWVTFAAGAETIPPVGGLSIVTQSGGFASYALMVLKRRQIGLNHWITLGNQADVDFAECVDYLADDPDTKVIVGYLEGIEDGAKLVAALEKARRNRKPVIITKVGASEAGAHATASHTATLAGSDAVYDAVLRQCGAYRAESVTEAFNIAYACLTAPSLPESPRTAIVTVSGGFGVLMADAATRAGLDVAPLQDELQTRMRVLLPYSNVRNPVDITAQLVNDFSLVEKTFDALFEGEAYDIVVNYQSGIDFSPIMRPKMLAVLEAFRRQRPDAVVALVLLTTPEIRAGYEKLNYLVFEDPTEPFRVLAALHHFARSFTEAPEADHPGSLRKAELPAGAVTLNEHDAKRILGAAGLTVLGETLAASEDEAAAAAGRIGGPVALKVVSAALLHKSDIGGVELGLENEETVRAAFRRILDNVARHAPTVGPDGILVSPMVTDGVEMSLGVQNDPVFGPVVMAGLGGTLIEVMKDVSLRRVPIGPIEAGRMLDELRGRAVLDGVRGKPAADVPALVEAIVALSRFAAAQADRIETIDVNPVLVRPVGKGAVAVDAVVSLRAAAASERA